MPIEDESSVADASETTLDNRIDAIEATIRRGQNISEDGKGELLTMVAGLKSELANLTRTHREEAASITRFADASAHEAARSQKNPQLAAAALEGLRLSIEGLEESHPTIVGIVNRFATALSNMGL